MGYWKNQFDKVARRAIAEYSQFHGYPVEQTGISILLEHVDSVQTGGVVFWITLKRQAKFQVKFLHLYHGAKARFDVTGMTHIIPKFIGKLMARLCEQHGIDPAVMNLQVCQDQEDIYVFLMNGTRMVKLLRDEETFDDEQIMADQMQEALS